MTSSSAAQTCLPCVVQVGFAGTRQLSLTEEQSQIVIKLLCEALEELPGKVGLQSHHFLCGISALAIGGDSLFTEACGRLQIPQRIFLPQPRDVFLEATGSDGADFTPAQKVEAERLLALPHVIQERIVSDASSRTERFAETNREINRVSDVVVCLSLRNPASSTGKPGGTRHLLELARTAGKPVLDLSLDLSDSAPRLRQEWHTADPTKHSWPPALPKEVADLPAPKPSAQQPRPTVSEFCSVVKTHSSGEAAKHRNRFTRAARIIVGTHLLATLCATLVLVLHGAHCPPVGHETSRVPPELAAPVGEHGTDAGHGELDWMLLGLLTAELMALVWGLWTHHRLRHSGPHPVDPRQGQTHRRGLTHAWALARLLAEINRSVSSLVDLHIYLEYLFRLRLPSRFQHLLRTINVLHLVTTRRSSRPWNELRDSYVVERLDGQHRYFQDRSHGAENGLKMAKFAFMTCSVAAIAATLIKLTILSEVLSAFLANNDFSTSGLGALAVIFPAVAVGVMSLAAAQTYEAQHHIYQEMGQWLTGQKQRFQQATSPQEFLQLVQETELRLLGETADWFSRRSFTGVP